MIDTKDEYTGPVYLREVEIRYNKKRVANEAADAAINSPGDVVKLFRGLEDETKEKLITINLDNQNKILCLRL
jgi:DNA repair protein RadC